MRNYLKILCFPILLSLMIYYLSIYLKEKKEPLFNPSEKHAMSVDIGHMLAHQLKNYAPHYDFPVVMATLNKIEQEEESLKPESECQLSLVDFRYKMLEEESQQNLKKAEQFLADLAHKPHIEEIISGKLYIEVLKPGNGEPLAEDAYPKLVYQESQLDKRIIREIKDEPIQIKLSETIKGFRDGVVGMQIGEKRRIYAHPDITYGKLFNYQMSIFEVEIFED